MASERGVHAASSFDYPGRFDFKRRRYPARRLKRRERPAPMFFQLRSLRSGADSYAFRRSANAPRPSNTSEAIPGSGMVTMNACIPWLELMAYKGSETEPSPLTIGAPQATSPVPLPLALKVPAVLLPLAIHTGLEGSLTS